MKFNIFRKEEQEYSGTIEILNYKDRYLYPEYKLYRKIKKLVKKYHSYDLNMINKNELELRIGNIYPFKLQNKFDYGYIFVPTKVSCYLREYKVKVKLIVNKE